MPISSLPSAYGIGTIGRAAYDFVDLLVDLKFRYWQILPIGPTSFGNSPYQALSDFAGNNYYIDLDELVNEGLLNIDEVREVDWGSNERDVDYGKNFSNGPPAYPAQALNFARGFHRLHGVQSAYF